MAMQVRLDVNGLDPLTRQVMNLPGDFSRARRSALSSIGFWIRTELQNHIEYGGGSDWPVQHPLTLKFKKKYRTGNKWFGRRAWGHLTPYFWLGRFSRYHISGDGSKVAIDFGRLRTFGDQKQDDPFIMSVVRRAESGERIHVTEAMRRFFGTTRRKRPKQQTPGETYFPLKKSTKYLDIPKRPVFGPVWRKVAPGIPQRFADKFWKAIERYNKRK